jgi:hypothetical protein
MSNHFSAADLKHPGDDARLDLTNLFVFAAPDNPGRTVLIMDSNPFTKGDGFHLDAVYRPGRPLSRSRWALHASPLSALAKPSTSRIAESPESNSPS